MSFKEKIQSGGFVVTTEIGPPKGVNVNPSIAEAAKLKGRVDAFNVTDLQGSVMRLGSLAESRLILDSGMEPIYQITCRDRNRLALQSDLLGAHALGIRNVLAMTGDHPALGDHPDAKPVYDFDSVSLIECVKKLNDGIDYAGHKLDGPTDYFVGAVVNPGADPLEPEIIKMEKKIGAGARFFQTQAVFDLQIFEKFMGAIRHLNIPVIAGIVLLKSAGMAEYLNKNVPGVNVPPGLIDRMRNAGDKKHEAIEIASGFISLLKRMASGVHIMPIGWYDAVPMILDKVNL